MSLIRRAKLRDKSEPEIVRTLQAVGAQCYRIDQPCDLIIKYRGVISLIDCARQKGSHPRPKKQLDTFAEWGVIVVANPQEALQAIGAFTKGFA